jgi:vacuolar-type H+-ATPase subunit D/Vma8
MEQRLQKLETEIKALRKDIQKLTTVCSRMNTHIDFVEDVYSTVRAPANYVKNKIETLMGVDKPPLPLPSSEENKIQEETCQSSDNYTVNNID